MPPPSAELNLPISSRSSSSRNSVKMVLTQSWTSVGPPGCSGHVGAEREARPVDHAAHDRRQARDADHAAFGARRREIFLVEHDRNRFVVHRHKCGLRQPAAQLGIAARGRRRRVGHVQHDRLDRAPPRLLHEADLRHHREELVERAVAQIDDLGARIVRDQPVEQRHLAAGVADVDGPDQVGEAAASAPARADADRSRRAAGRRQRKYSINSRASSVLPTRGRGDATM